MLGGVIIPAIGALHQHVFVFQRCTLPIANGAFVSLVAAEMQRQQYLGILQGVTALHTAATEATASELLKHGADITSRDHTVSQKWAAQQKS